MDASSLRKMTLRDRVIIPGGSHASPPFYDYAPAGPPHRRRAPANPPEVPGLQTQDLGPPPLVDPPGGRRSVHLGVGRLRATARRPLRRDGPPSPAGYPARVRRTATPPQRRVSRAPAQGPAQTPSSPGPRLDVDPLPRTTPPRPRRDLPQPGQERYQPFPCLCHGLRRPQGPALHRGVDRRPQGAAAEGGRPSPAATGRTRGHPTVPTPAGSRLLQRGRDPLPPSGALSVRHAGGLPWPLPEASQRSQRQLCLPDVEDQRMVHLHPDRRAEAHGHSVDLREVPQLPGAVEEARTPALDLRLLGSEAGLTGVGLRDLPAAVRDRDELSADARGPDPDDDAQPGSAAVVCGTGVGPAECVGVATLRDLVHTPAWRRSAALGATAVGDAAGVAAACSRGDLGHKGHHLHRTDGLVWTCGL